MGGRGMKLRFSGLALLLQLVETTGTLGLRALKQHFISFPQVGRGK